MNKDSNGDESVNNACGVQWMTEGRGLIHSENSSTNFLANGSIMEILLLWVNLPANYKMVDAAYKSLQKKDIPPFKMDNGKVIITAVSGVLGRYQRCNNSHGRYPIGFYLF